jgi:hypothetical protein
VGGQTYHSYDAQLAGIQVQTSLLGKPMAIGWGRGRLSCNLIDYVGFVATPHTEKVGGKGGGSAYQTSYTYTASIIMALCEGPITGVRTVYKDASALTDGTTTSLAQAGLSLALGTQTQTPWPYMTSMYPSHALAYRGIAYVYAQDYALGNNAALPNHGFEVDFGIQFGPNGDADPKDIVTDYLTNTQYGVSGWGAGLLGDLSDFSLYCRANNLLLSPVLESQVTGQDFLRRIFDQTNCEPVWSEGVLKVRTYGDANATGNSVTWTADLTPEYDLNEDDFLDEVELEVVDQSDAYNYVQVEYLDRSNQYQPAVAVAQDLDNVMTFGLRKRDPEQFHDICDPNIAQKVAQLRLQQTLYRRDKFTFMLPQDFIALEPMDYVTLTTTVDGMALDHELVIIDSIDEDEDGNLQVVAWGVPGATASAAQNTSHSSDGYQPNPDVAPGSVSTPVLIDAPKTMTGLDPEVWIGAAGSNVNWGGCQVWISADNTSFQQVGEIRNPASIGVLTAALADAADPDTTNTCRVNMAASKQALLSTSASNQSSGATLFMVDNELMTYQTATLTATDRYNLTTLGRGILGTAHASHASGAKFAMINDAIFRLPYKKLNFGTTMYVKLPSFNIYGRALEDISAVPSYSLTLSPTGTATDWRDIADLANVDGYLTKSAVAIAAYAEGTVANYNGASGTFVVMDGVTDISSNFTLSTVSNPQGLVVNYTGRNFAVTGGMDPGEDTATLVIRATGSGQYGAVYIDKSFVLSKFKGGYEIVGALPTTNLFDGRFVYNTADGKLWKYVGTPGSGGAWQTGVAAVDISGSLTNAQIADLNAAKLTGTLGANLFAANTIVAGKLVLMDPSNMIPDPLFFDTGNSITDNSWYLGTVGGTTTWSKVTGTAATTALGVNDALQSPSGNGTTSQGGGQAYVPPSRIMVEGDKKYRIYARAYLPSGFTGWARIIVRWYLADGVTSAGSNTTVNPSTNGDFRSAAAGSATTLTFDAQVQAPSTAVLCRLDLRVDWSTTLANAGYLAFATPRMQRAADASLLVDGQVTALKLATDSVTTNALAAGVVTAAKVDTTSAVITDTIQIANAVVKTANIDDLQVTSLKIGNNAVTVPTSASTSGAISCPDNAETIVQTVSVVTSGAPAQVLLLATVQPQSTSNYYYAQVRIYRDTTLLWTATNYVYSTSGWSPVVNAQVLDAPAAGSYTYKIAVYVSGTGAGAQAVNRVLTVMEVKK